MALAVEKSDSPPCVRKRKYLSPQKDGSESTNSPTRREASNDPVKEVRAASNAVQELRTGPPVAPRDPRCDGGGGACLTVFRSHVGVAGHGHDVVPQGTGTQQPQQQQQQAEGRHRAKGLGHTAKCDVQRHTNRAVLNG